MEKQVDKKFTWVIKNFSSLQSEKIYSDPFVIGGCKWRLLAYPKGNNSDNNFSLYGLVAESKYLLSGWRRHAKFSFTIIDQTMGKLFLMKEFEHWFNEKESDWGFKFMIHLNELKAKDSGYLVNGELKIVVEVNVLEVVGQLDVTEETSSVKENVDVNGFQVLPSQVEFVKHLFDKYPDLASNVRQKNPHLKTGHMNVLLSLNEFLRQSPENISKGDIADANAATKSLIGAGFKLDWLKKKLNEVSEKKEKEEACEIRIEEIKKELNDFKQKCSNLESLLEKEKAELLAARTPVLCDDGL